MNGTVFDIQHYAVHDGPGIRTLVFFKGCPLACLWCCNPESQDFRPQLRYFPSRCKSSLSCLHHCPDRVVSINDTHFTHSPDHCKNCISRVCVEKCDHGALSISGKTMSAAEVMEIVARDIPFYRNSGGGVTFSGGEPLSQPEFLLDLLRQCNNLEIHTAIETSGWSDRESLRQISPLTGLFLFDLKIIDPAKHLAFTGKPVARILENLAFLASERQNIIIRLPLVPEITDTMSNLEAISAVMAVNSLEEIVLEPYHSLGVEKYQEIGMQYHLTDVIDYPFEKAVIARDFFKSKGLNCEIA